MQITAKGESAVKNPPVVHLEVPSKQISEIQGTKPGQKMKVMIEGEITSVAIRESYDPEVPGNIGDLSLEITQLKFMPTNNDISELLDEDE